MNTVMKKHSAQMFSILLLLLTSVILIPLQAAVTLAPLFADGAVLQRDKTIPIWGTASAGERISVVFAGQSLVATADSEGRWRVNLKPIPASSIPRTIVVKAGNTTLTVQDVVVGEVWLASGQSNMEWPLDYSANAKKEIAAANFPLVRQFKVAKEPSFTPMTTVAGAWAPALPDTAGKFSGVAYYFALAIHRELNVPIGILNSSWGGTGIDTWISPDACRTTPALAGSLKKLENGRRATEEEKADYQKLRAEWQKEKEDASAARLPFHKKPPETPPGFPTSRTLTGLYNGMIHPLTPYALRGAIWYQGESSTSIIHLYPGRMTALIEGWRNAFEQGDFPFYWVQLPNLDIGGLNQTSWVWADMREAQSKSLSIPNTGQAITIDVGENKGLHPKNKKSVGERLALLALARTYGLKGVVDSGPVFSAAKREGEAYRILFHVSPSPLKSAPAGLTGFELAGADQKFYPADAVIDGATVLVTSPDVKNPVAVRYAYRNAPEVGLYNAAGLPAAPFRTDTWPAPKQTKVTPASAAF